MIIWCTGHLASSVTSKSIAETDKLDVYLWAILQPTAALQDDKGWRNAKGRGDGGGYIDKYIVGDLHKYIGFALTNTSWERLATWSIWSTDKAGGDGPKI